MSSVFCQAQDVILGAADWTLNSTPLSFALPEGNITALIGRNGAGKTTLLRALLGEPVVRQGSLHIAGIDARTASYRDRSAALAFVPQEHEFPGDATVEALLKLAFLPKMGLWGRPPKSADAEIDSALKSFGLVGKQHRRLHSLSTGERQRALLARALLQKPKALILDEPTNHLDPAAVRSFWKALMAQTRDRGLNLLVSTHDLQFVRQHCDFVLALENGKKAFEGTRKQFLDQNIEAALFDD